jgi:ferritin-like metal-binding protein YciE
MKDLEKLFLDELADIYNAETQLTKALPKMAKAAQSEELRSAFEEHLEQTKEQINRLDQVFESLGESMKKKTCKGMKGLIEEGNEVAEEFEDESALDAGLICAAQKVEHYEICSYGCLVTWGKELGHDDAVELLQKTLSEEKETDQKLTELAQSSRNVEALHGAGD